MTWEIEVARATVPGDVIDSHVHLFTRPLLAEMAARPETPPRFKQALKDGKWGRRASETLPDMTAEQTACWYAERLAAADVAKIKAPVQIHYAALDDRINEGWPAYEAALKAAGTRYEMHMYPGTNHGFHNDTTPRYDEPAAKLAWQRTLDFFNKNVRTG